MSGFLLGQPASYGLTQQITVVAGKGDTFAVPAAGASATYTVADYDRWRLIACYFELTTSAAAANRLVTVQYLGSNNVSPVLDGAGLVITANTSAQPFSGSLNRGVAEWATGTPIYFPLSGLWLEAGQQVKINVGAIDATDQLANLSLTFDRLTVDPEGYEKLTRQREAG